MDCTVDELLAANTIRKSRVEYLVQAETAGELESHLTKILERVNDSVVEWEKVGELVNNAVVAEVTDNMTGVVENITNASDAYLLQNYDGTETYTNSHEAADALLTDETVTMRFDGNKGKGRGSTEFSLTFADAAHGQPTDNFDVFVKPFESGVSKQEYPFLQGCRGVGGMTALSHTEHGHKFIASASDKNPEAWTWTVIRRGSDGDYYYLTIDGRFPTFEGTFDCGEGIGEKRQGTVVKLYSYNLATNPENAAGGTVFTRRLARYLPDPVVPLEIVDTRYDTDNSCTYTGLREAITEHSEVFRDSITTSEDVFGIGTVEIEAYIAESEEARTTLYEQEQVSEAIRDLRHVFTAGNDDRLLISLNGQAHARYSKANLKSEGDIPNIGDQMIVLVRIIDSGASIEQDMFNTARDGFSDGTKEQTLLGVVNRFLQQNERIQELDEQLADSDDKTTSVTIPTSMSVGLERVSVPTGVDQIAVPLVFDAPLSKVIDEHSATFTTPAEDYAVRVEAASDGTVAYIEPTVAKPAGTTDTVTIIGRFGNQSAAPQVAITYVDGSADSETDSVDWSFTNLLETTELHPVHKETLGTLETYDVADIAYDLLETHQDVDVLANIETIIRQARSTVEQRAAAHGKDISQASRVAVGTLFETLVYVSLVDDCEEHGYIVRHEPSFDDLDGVDGDDIKPDMDIVIEKQGDENGPLYIFSLKTSLRERIGQSLFWKLLLDMSTCECSDPSCVVNNTDHAVLTKNTRDQIQYGYVTLGWSQGGNTKVLEQFDMGYVPRDNMGDDVSNQHALSTLRQHLEMEWTAIE